MDANGPEAAKAKNPLPVPPDTRQAPPRIRLEDLLRGCREAIILHGPEEYRLRLTRNGKLILTK